MEDSILEKFFANLDEKIDDIKKTTEKIDIRQSKQYKIQNEQGMEIGYMEKELHQHKIDVKEVFAKNEANAKEKINNLWEEIRRRDKKTMWIISLVVPFISALIAGIMTWVQA